MCRTKMHKNTWDPVSCRVKSDFVVFNDDFFTVITDFSGFHKIEKIVQKY